VLSKREARIERQNAKRLADQQEAKKLRLKIALPERRQPRAGADPGSIFALPMIWSEENADREGAWSWGQERDWGAPTWTETIHPKLLEWERLTWGEIDRLNTGSGHKMHHSMSVEDLCDESQLRLMDLGQSDESIFRFRMGNKRRLWGFRVVSEFQILWYDPEHQIYPVDPE
jgi:hypothetical protein